MSKNIALTAILISISMWAAALNIYDVQFTNTRGVDNSYPSPYLGKAVTLEGIVTAANYQNEGFFISEKANGAWRGIYIKDDTYHPSGGSLIRVSGTVSEYYGMTCLQDIRSFQILDRNRTLPMPVMINTGQLCTALDAEAYEGVYCRVVSSTVISSKNKTESFMANDGSGQCCVMLGSFGNSITPPSTGTQYSQIAGVVDFSFGQYSLNPIRSSDYQIQQPVSVQNRSWGKIKSIYK
jgi:hypothetical protein